MTDQELEKTVGEKPNGRHVPMDAALAPRNQQRIKGILQSATQSAKPGYWREERKRERGSVGGRTVDQKNASVAPPGMRCNINSAGHSMLKGSDVVTLNASANWRLCDS